jgi:hypothetical protein
MLREIIDFPGTFAASLDPILGVVGTMTALAAAGAMLAGALAVLTPRAQPVR